MQNLKIALVQCEQFWEDKGKNRKQFENLFKTLEEGVDLVILPEMFETSFSMNTELAEEWNAENSGLVFLKKMSEQYKVAIYTSMMVREENTFFNRGVFIAENDVFTYDKRKLFGLGGETNHFSAGELEQIVNFKNWKINLQICYDLRFPENIRNSIVCGEPRYDVLLYVANWPKRRSTHWQCLLRARAIENQVFCIGVNRVGIDANELEYEGCSGLIDPLGEGDLLKDEKKISYFILNKEHLTGIRNNLPFLKDANF